MISKHATHIAFIFLVALTAISWVMNANADQNSVISETLVIATMVIGFLKAGAIIAYFMEVKDAPRPLQAIMGIWTVGVCTALTSVLVIL